MGKQFRISAAFDLEMEFRSKNARKMYCCGLSVIGGALELAGHLAAVFYRYLIYYKIDLQSRLTILQCFWKSSMLIEEPELPFPCKLGNIGGRSRSNQAAALAATFRSGRKWRSAEDGGFVEIYLS